MARKDRKDRGLFSYLSTDGTKLYGVRIWTRGRAHKWQGFKKIQQARDWYEDRKKDIRENRPFPPRRGEAVGTTVEQVIAQYLAQATNKKNYGGEQTYGKFWQTRLGRIGLTHLSPDMIDKARTHLLTVGAGKRPLTHATVNRYVAWLHHVCRLEVEKGMLQKNPCRRLKFKEAKAPEVEFTEAEEVALARELGSQADYPSFAILTGLRQGEQFGLRWDALDLVRGFGKLHDPKSGEPQIFLLNEAAKMILERLKQAAGDSPWVFPHPKNLQVPINPKTWYNHVFKPAAKRAGITLSRKHGKTFHTLRHTFASRLQQEGVEVKDIKDLGRWKTWKAMDRYLKRDTARLRSSIEKLRTARKPPVDSEEIS